VRAAEVGVRLCERFERALGFVVATGTQCAQRVVVRTLNGHADWRVGHDGCGWEGAPCPVCNPHGFIQWREVYATTDPERDKQELELELVVADRDHVEKRLARVRSQAKSGDPALRKEAEELERVLAHVEAGNPLSSYPGTLPGDLEPLTTKPLIHLVNGAGGFDLKLEAELAELSPEDASAFRDGPASFETVLAGVFDAVGLIVFFTAGDTETRAWTLRRGQTALEAAATIHTDIARGFIRCEVIASNDLVEAGSRAEAARRGQQRLEGKDYVVADGDVLNVRFNV